MHHKVCVLKKFFLLTECRSRTWCSSLLSWRLCSTRWCCQSPPWLLLLLSTQPGSPSRRHLFGPTPSSITLASLNYSWCKHGHLLALLNCLFLKCYYVQGHRLTFLWWFRDCAKILVTSHSTAPENKLKVVYKKYSSEKLGGVALRPPATEICK